MALIIFHGSSTSIGPLPAAELISFCAVTLFDRRQIASVEGHLLSTTVERECVHFTDFSVVLVTNKDDSDCAETIDDAMKSKYSYGSWTRHSCIDG